MTNKVKPFYIEITDNMTPQMVQDAFDKCRKLGVKDTELCDSLDYSHWVYFGVCGRDGLYYSDYHDNFHGDAQEITLDQLDEWLGLESKVDWNGKGLPPVGVECDVYCPVNPTLPDGDKDWMNTEVVAIINCGLGAETTVVYKTGWSAQWYVDAHPSNILKFRKPETPEQKAERERLENGRELWLKHQQALADVKILPSGKNKAWDSNMLSNDEMESWCILAENVTWMK